MAALALGFIQPPLRVYRFNKRDHMTISLHASKNSWITRNFAAIISVLAVAFYAAFIEWLWGWQRIFFSWQEAGWQVACASIVLILFTYVLRTWRIRDYFPAETAGQFRRLLRLVQVHNLLNIMLPLRSGEVSFPILMKQEFGISLARATSALLVMRLLDLHALLAAAGTGLALEEGSLLAWLLWLIFAILPLAAFMLRKPLLDFAQAAAPSRLQAALFELKAGLPADLAAFMRAWMATLINWFVKVAVMAWVLILLADLDIAAAFGGGLGGELSSVLPVHAPGGVGTYPAGITAGAVTFGASTSQDALALLGKAAVNAHLLIILSSILGTVISMMLAGRKRRED